VFAFLFIAGHGTDCPTSGQDKQEERGEKDDEYDAQSQAAGTIQLSELTLVTFVVKIAMLIQFNQINFCYPPQHQFN
jgi:hypothetical protein